jgi:putative nuclease YbcO-like protein
MKRTPLARKTPLKAKTQLRARAPMRKRSRKTTPMRQGARGQPCLLNVANVCNYNPETTVLAHFRWLGDCGMAFKPDDRQGCPSCDACNRWTDSPTPRQVEDCGGRIAYERDRNFYAARALARLRITEAEEAA